jgi:hypothetical protein
METMTISTADYEMILAKMEEKEHFIELIQKSRNNWMKSYQRMQASSNKTILELLERINELEYQLEQTAK